MTKKTQTQIETGDFVEITSGPDAGWVGILDNEFVVDGEVRFAVISEEDPEDFRYAASIKLYRKAA